MIKLIIECTLKGYSRQSDLNVSGLDLMYLKIFKYLQVCEVILELGESETNVKYEVAWPPCTVASTAWLCDTC